jgi:hypothetical protein
MRGPDNLANLGLLEYELIQGLGAGQYNIPVHQADKCSQIK